MEFDDITECIDPENLVKLFDSEPILEELEQSIKELEKSIANQRTLKQTNQYVEKFHKFMADNPSIKLDLESASPESIANTLRIFYGHCYKPNGDCYSPSTLICIRAALFRYFMRNRAINIIKDNCFYATNEVLKNMAKKFICNGGRVNHYQAIEPEDMQKLARYFDRSSPEVLLHEIYYNTIYYFGQRGREWLRDLNVERFVFETKADGTETVRMSAGKVKNVGNDFSRASCDDIKEAVMFSMNGPNCPIKALKLYIAKRLESIQVNGEGSGESSTAFFLKPKRLRWQNSIWYCGLQPIGINNLANTMSSISLAAGLSKKYTAHCIRPTVIKELSNSGYNCADICKITGHKQVRTVERYLQFGSRRDSEMQAMCSSLYSSLQAGKDEKSSTVEVTKEVAANVGNSQAIAPISINLSGSFSNCKIVLLDSDKC